MERNADGTFGATGNVGSTGVGSTNFDSTNLGSSGTAVGAGMAGNTQPAGGLDYSAGTTPSSTPTPGAAADQLKTGAQDAYGQLREKTRSFQSTLADRLEQGAEKLRNRNQSQSSTLAGATGEGSVSVAATERTKMQDSVAIGMEKSADWLRNGDLKADIERQVRDNPGRTLLVALGVGYLLGKAFRGPNR